MDADFFTLQVGDPAQSELAALIATGWRGPQLIDLTPSLHDFSDTAALMMQLDLILSVDTACAHLAGALGKEVWILNRHDACWRWLIAREDSPWYPSAKLYRQSRPHDWADVVQQVFTDLDDRVSSFEGKVTPYRQTTNT
jgi:ADP-heptose:LPS heptosyltransferase